MSERDRELEEGDGNWRKRRERQKNLMKKLTSIARQIEGKEKDFCLSIVTR